MTKSTIAVKKGGILKAVSSSPFFYAFTINVVVFVLALLFCDFKYEVSDDFIMEGILSGAYNGHTDPHLLFSNILLGYFLKFFYDLFPTVSFYFVFLELTGFLSLFAVSYAAAERLGPAIGVPISTVFVLVFSDDLYILPSFTKTATAAAAAGGLLFLCVVWNMTARKIPALILSILLLLSGTLLRQKCFLMAVPFLFAVFVVSFIRRIRCSKEKEKRKKELFKGGAIFGASLAFVLLSYFLTNMSTSLWFKEDAYADYKNFNAVRAQITDTIIFGYDSVVDQYDDLGLSETDYHMIESWNFVDRSVYDDAVLEEIGNIKKAVSDSVYHTFDGMSQQIIQRGYFGYQIVIAGLIIMAIFLMMDPRNGIPLLICTTVCFILLAMTYYNGRYLYRLEYGIIFSAVASMIFACDAKVDGEAFKKRLKVSLAVIAAFVFAFKLPLYYKDTSYETLTTPKYGTYLNDTVLRSGYYSHLKYRVYIDEDELYGELFDRIENDDEHYYLLTFTTTIQRILYTYNPWERVPANEWRDNYSFLGGVTTMYPANQEAWAYNGINPYDPYLSLVNDNVYVVDNNDFNTKLEYLREHYYPDARMELVDTLNGFKIWKFYIE